MGVCTCTSCTNANHLYWYIFNDLLRSNAFDVLSSVYCSWLRTKTSFLTLTRVTKTSSSVLASPASQTSPLTCWRHYTFNSFFNLLLFQDTDSRWRRSSAKSLQQWRPETSPRMTSRRFECRDSPVRQNFDWTLLSRSLPLSKKEWRQCDAKT